MDTEPRQVRVYLPSLVERLIHAEAAKGDALSEPEVIAIVIEAETIPMIEPHALMMEGRRGYRDIDPDHAWSDWQAFRNELAAAGESETS